MDAKAIHKFAAYVDYNHTGKYLKLTGSKKYRRLWLKEKEKNRRRKLITFDDYLKKSKRAYEIEQKKDNKAEQRKDKEVEQKKEIKTEHLKEDIVEEQKTPDEAEERNHIVADVSKTCLTGPRNDEWADKVKAYMADAKERNERLGAILDFFADDMAGPHDTDHETDLQQDNSTIPAEHGDEIGDVEPDDRTDGKGRDLIEIRNHIARYARVRYDARPRPTGNIIITRPRTAHPAVTSQYDVISASPSAVTMVTGELSRSHSLDTIYLGDVTSNADDIIYTRHLIGQHREPEVESIISSWSSSNSLHNKPEVESYTIMTSWPSLSSLNKEPEVQSLVLSSRSPTSTQSNGHAKQKSKMSRVKKFFVELFGCCIRKQEAT